MRHIRTYSKSSKIGSHNNSIGPGNFCLNNDKRPTNSSKEHPKNHVKFNEMKQEQVLHMSFHVTRFSPLSMESPRINIYIYAPGLDR
jgi:hypothetical protein